MSDEYEYLEGEESEESPAPIHDVDPVSGIAWGVLLLFVGIGLVVIFAVQNTTTVPVKFLWLDGDYPLSIVILTTAVVAFLLGELLALVYRRRRRERLVEKEELRRLREESK